MKKCYTAFKLCKETEFLKDAGCNRYEDEQDAINELSDLSHYDDEFVILPIFVPTRLQKYIVAKK